MAQNSTATGFHLDLQNFEVRDVDFYGSIQERLERYGEEWSTFAQALWGKPFSNFLNSTPANERMDDSWQPVRALGKGGFGMVGLWEKRSRKGHIKDSIAIKEMRRDVNRDLHLQRDPTLAREAVMMQQLNAAERGCGWQTKNNILRLRSFKFFPAMNRWRFYLEFAERGDFYKLLSSYRAWDTYLPEEFLWHTFHSLAKVALVMEQGPFLFPESLEPNNGPVLHLDIKPENIFMGKPDKKAVFTKYPTIKVADFGLSEMTDKDDPDNPMMYRKGTLDHMAPEVTCFTAHWKRRPDGIQHDLTQYSADEAINIERGMRDPGYKYLSAHNVWGFGKLMYDMMTLSWSYELDEEMYKSTTEEMYYSRLNQHAIFEITTLKNPEYSSSLRNLIRECLHIEIGRRPTPQQLLERTQRGLEVAAQSRQQDADERGGPRVYHMGNEINHMPLGNVGLSATRSDWKAIREQFWLDPHWEPLLSGRWAPQVQGGELVNQPIEEGGPKRPVRPFNAGVKADPRPADNFQNHRGVIWTIDSSSADRDTPRNHGESNGDDQRELEHQDDSGEDRPTSKPHDTWEVSPRPNEGAAPAPSEAPDDALTSLERATQFLADAAREVAHLGNVSPRPVQRLKINPPKPPAKKQLQPKQTKKRKRVMGISVDDIAKEVQGRNAKGHNLRPRRGRRMS